MAHRIAAQTGDKDILSTWVGGVVPGDGDTYENGDYLITVSTNWTVGTNPTAGSRVVIDNSVGNGNGSIRVMPGITLNVKGEIAGKYESVTFEAGSTFNTEVGVTEEYGHNFASSWDDHQGSLVCNGVEGNRVTISKTGAGVAWLEICPDSMGGHINCQYTDFIGLGSLTVDAIQFRRSTNMSHCTFDGCGTCYLGTYSQLDFILSDMTWTNSIAGTRNLFLDWEWEALTSTRSIHRCSFDTIPVFFKSDGFVPTDCFFADSFETGFPENPVAIFENNFVVGIPVAPFEAQTLKDNFFYALASQQENPHYTTSSIYISAQTWVGNMYELGGASPGDTGEFITAGESTVPTVLTVENNISLRDADGGSSGGLIGIMGNVNTKIRLRNNTYPGISCPRFAETYPGHADMIEEFKNNLAHATPAEANSYALLFIGPSYATGYLTNGNNNNGHNVVSMYDASPGDAFGTPPGTGDTNNDPQFAEGSRKLAPWATSIGLTGTDVEKRQAVLDLFADMDANEESPSDCITWIKEGIVPTNIALATAGEGGTWQGALEPVAAQTSDPNIKHRVFVDGIGLNGDSDFLEHEVYVDGVKV